MPSKSFQRPPNSADRAEAKGGVEKGEIPLPKNSFRSAFHWQSLVGKLEAIRSSYLAKTAQEPILQDVKEIFNYTLLIPGQVLALGSNSKEKYLIQRVLGSGSEGCVYLADSNAGEFAVKQFYKPGSLLSHQRAYEAMKSGGVPMPNLVDRDRGKGCLIFEHIRAVPVSHLILATPAGVSSLELRVLRGKLDVFVREHPGVDDHQIVVEIGSGKLFCVDPV